MALRLNPDTLDGIETQYSGNSTGGLILMVTEWLRRKYNVKKFGEPTWQKLVKAVAHHTGGANMALAKDMARRHRAGGMFSGYTLAFYYHPFPPTVHKVLLSLCVCVVGGRRVVYNCTSCNFFRYSLKFGEKLECLGRKLPPSSHPPNWIETW